MKKALSLLLLAATLQASAQPAQPELIPEPLALPAGAAQQVYNFQEQGGWRVWARSAAGFRGAQIWLQQREGRGAWSEPALWAQSDARYRDSDPFLSADGKRLIFVSDRPEAPEAPPQKQLDLFESRWDGQAWSAPQRLPAALQGPGYELGPERHGAELLFASAQAGKPLSIQRAAGAAPPEALPSPVNEAGSANSDPTLSPDGRYLIWWSQRSGDGDLYLAERLGQGRYGPALRLPEGVNSAQGFEFTPWISADGEWLYFASTRAAPAVDAGLARVYRVRWPAVLQALGTAAQQASDAALAEAQTQVWRALSHGPGSRPDAEALARLLHPQARIWGALLRERQPQLAGFSRDEFLKLLATPDPRPMRECELARETRRYGAAAQVYSRVRSDREHGSRPYTGVNSLQWQLGEQGWQLLSLHFALDLPGAPLPAEGDCR